MGVSGTLMTSDPYSTMVKQAMSKIRKALSVAIIVFSVATIALRIIVIKMDKE